MSNRNITLLIWAIPYAARWSLSKVGIVVTIPPAGCAQDKREEALQQFFAVGLLTIALMFVSPPVALVVGGILMAVKLYNLWRIKLNN